MNNPNIMIIAAEASSSIYAARLMQYWIDQGLKLNISGVGSAEMEKLGMIRLGRSEEMAIVGFGEIISQYPKIKKIFNLILSEIQIKKPKFILLMDYAGFNLRLAQKIKESKELAQTKVFYYISPHVWVWRKNRIYSIKKYCDHVFLLFPFEKTLYDQHQISNEFVGHPLLEDIDSKFLNPQNLQQRKEKYAFSKNEIVLGLMPGSRKSEIKYNFPMQLKVAQTLCQRHKNLRLIILVAPTLKKEDLLFYINQLDSSEFSASYILIQDDPASMISLSDLVLVCSGTATLLVGLLLKPMVIMYKVKWTTYIIGKTLIRGLKYFGLINIVLGDEVVPERLQNKAHHDELVQLLDRYIVEPGFYKKTQEKLAQASLLLGEKGASQRVASALLKYL